MKPRAHARLVCHQKPGKKIMECPGGDLRLRGNISRYTAKSPPAISIHLEIAAGSGQLTAQIPMPRISTIEPHDATFHQRIGILHNTITYYSVISVFGDISRTFSVTLCDDDRLINDDGRARPTAPFPPHKSITWNYDPLYEVDCVIPLTVIHLLRCFD